MGVSGNRRKRHDHYFRKARKEQYRARSVYKLQEIDDRFHLVKPGITIVDLGAAPGSWSQFAAQKVGPSGTVYAIDRKPLDEPLPSQIIAIQADVLSESVRELSQRVGDATADLVMSDMAPNTTGVREVDHARSIDLCERALEIAHLLLKPGGSWVCKAFQGAYLDAFAAEAKPCFSRLKRFKPKSSRPESVEFFFVGTGFVPRERPAPEDEPPKMAWDPLSS